MAGVFASRFPLIGRLGHLMMWPLSVAAVVQCVRNFVNGGIWGQDAHAYWTAVQGPLVYGTAPGQRDAFLYSPAFADVIRPLGYMPWPLFCTVWVLFETLALLWLIRPLPVKWAIPVFLVCTPELVVGNIYLLIAVATVIGMRHSAAWTFPILTKVTVGVGLLWHVGRRDWKAVAMGIGAPVVVALVFAVFNPGAWLQWFDFLVHHGSGTPDSTLSFMIRCAIAAVLALLGARAGWAFLVPFAVMLATPVLVWPIPLMALAAIPRILVMEGSEAPHPIRTASFRQATE